MVNRLLITAVVTVGLSLSFRAQTPAPASQTARETSPATVPRIPHTKFVLPNGLTLLVHEDHKAPIAAVNVWYHVGSKNEKPGKTGFAHLFEHLMFNGSENFKDDYFKAVEPIGATDLNGTTNPDRTNYFQNVPVPALDRVLWLESDRMGHLLGAIDQAVLDEQRGVVQNEKRQGENQPYGKQWITVAENSYPKGHPYSWSVIGSMEDLNAAALEDVKEWFRGYYGAANAVLVVAGDITPEVVRTKVERYFGDIPSGPPVAKHQEWIARQPGLHRQMMQDRVPQARIIKVWNVPGVANMESVPLQMVQAILATGKTSRLYKRLVYRDRIATDTVGFTDQREIGGQIWMWADAQPGGDLSKVEQAMDEEIARFLRDGPTAAEVEEARVRLRANYVRGIERIGGFGGKSDILAQGQVYANDPDLIPKKVDRAQRTTAAEIAAAARRWLADGPYVLEVRPFPEYKTLTTSADRSKLPDPGEPPPVDFPAVEKATLAKGLKVQLVRRTAVPVVGFSLLIDAGYAADRSATPGTARLALDMLDEGTTTRTSEQISERLAALGASINMFCDLDACHVTLNALRDKLDPSLEIYTDVLLNPSFPQKDLDRIKQNTLARIQQEKVQPVSMALRVLPLLLYGPEHAYGTPLTGSGTEETVRAMTRDDLRRFHRTWFHPSNATILVAGDITMVELRPKLETAFAAWPSGEVARKEITEPPVRPSSEVFFLDRPGAEQTVILAAQLAPPKKYAREMAFQLFNDSFGGAFGSRVNLNLREDKHWSYGAGSFAFDARGQRLWFVYAPVQTDKTKESLKEIMKELGDVTGSRRLSAEELQEAKERQTRTLAGRWETANAVLGAMREMVGYELPEDYYATFAQRAAAVTIDDVQRVVGEVLRPDRQVYVLVGDRAKIEAGVRELNLGPVHLLDADGRPKQSTP
jgi:zinc protease